MLLNINSEAIEPCADNANFEKKLLNFGKKMMSTCLGSDDYLTTVYEFCWKNNL